jgi:hypothetical protein
MKDCGDWCCPMYAIVLMTGRVDQSMSLALRQYAAIVKSVICHRQDGAKRRNDREEVWDCCGELVVRRKHKVDQS